MKIRFSKEEWLKYRFWEVSSMDGRLVIFGRIIIIIEVSSFNIWN